MKQLLKVATAAGIALLASMSISLAGPEGVYDVVGTNPGGGEYEGTVIVERTGETYAVLWEIGGTEFIGSGLGAAPVKGQTIVGPAADTDYVLAVGYVSSEADFGIAYYVEQEDGVWEGIWTFGGEETIATETWFPR